MDFVCTYVQERLGGIIGIALDTKYFEPYSKSSKDKAATARLLGFNIGWFAVLLVYGDYPKCIRKLVKERLPIFSKQEKSLLKGSFDYLGLNNYSSACGRNMQKPPKGVLHHEVDSLAPVIGKVYIIYISTQLALGMQQGKQGFLKQSSLSMFSNFGRRKRGSACSFLPCEFLVSQFMLSILKLYISACNNNLLLSTKRSHLCVPYHVGTY